MGNYSNLQTSFLGGEWSPYAQGRADDKDYRTAMNVCANSLPLEAGAWTRRPGTRFLATTRNGQQGWLVPFAFASAQPYMMEFTNQMVRFFNGTLLVSTNDAQDILSISTANPAAVKTRGTHGWSTGQQIQIIFSAANSYPLAGILMNRQFLITVTGSDGFTISDPITGEGIDGSTLTYTPQTGQAIRVLEIAAPYITNQLPQVRGVQAEGVVVTLHPDVAPWTLSQATAPTPALEASFTYSASSFIDGPYLDPNTTGTLTNTGTSGTITLSGAPAGTFTLVTDVGRLIRILSEPAAYNPATGYAAGNSVKFGGLYYTAIIGSTGQEPDIYPQSWALNSSAATWTWGTIATVASDTQVTVAISGANLLYTGVPINTWRLGVYSLTTGFPTCGVYHEGRLWLAGAVGNRIDASNSGLPFNFTPTAVDGTVSDANAISYVFNASDVNEIYWMKPNTGGIVCGTQGGEWLVAASQLNDPLTPTSIQAHRRSRYRGRNLDAVDTGISVLFAQGQGRRLIEYVSDTFSGKFLGRNMSQNAGHLTNVPLAQLAYQQELTPICWARCEDNSLIGMTYKRESSFTSEPPAFYGWHRHTLGTDREVESIAVGPSPDGNIETLSLISNDPATGIRHVEMLTTLFDETSVLTDSWFLDDAVTPSAAVENSANTSITFYGSFYNAGNEVSVWAAGLDLGDYAVAADGSVTVPINSPTNAPLFTDSLLSTMGASEAALTNFDGLGMQINRSVSVSYPGPSGEIVQSYIQSGTINGALALWVDDYKHNTVYAVSAGTNANDGIVAYNRLTGALLRERSIQDILPFPRYTNNHTFGSGMTLGEDGMIYFCSPPTNSAILFRVSAADFSLQGQFGESTSGFAINNFQMPYIQNCVHTNVAGTNFLVWTGLVMTSLGVTNTDNMSWAGHSFNYLEGAPGTLCLGEEMKTAKGAYSAIYSSSLKGDGSTVGIYRTVIQEGAGEYSNPPGTTGPQASIDNGGITTNRIGSITPTQIDATWTTIANVYGFAFDQSDNNLFAVAVTANSVTNQAYIMKVSTVTGAIIWKTAIPNQAGPGSGTGPSASPGMQQSIVKYGLYSFAQGSAPMTIITATSAGSVTATQIPGLTSTGTYSSGVDIDGSVIGGGAYSSSTPGAPVGVNGTTTFNGKLWKLQGLTGFPGQTTDTISTTIPVVIGSTYNSDGQVLRGIAAEATGARAGPALGKTRRNHRISALMANIQGVSFGTTFDNLRPAKLASAGGTVYPIDQLYSNVYSSTVEDTYSYDGMVCWRISRPYPGSIASMENFLETQDR